MLIYSHYNLKTSLGHVKYCYFSFHQNIWILVVLQHKWLVQMAFPHLKKFIPHSILITWLPYVSCKLYSRPKPIVTHQANELLQECKAKQKKKKDPIKSAKKIPLNTKKFHPIPRSEEINYYQIPVFPQKVIITREVKRKEIEGE